MLGNKFILKREKRLHSYDRSINITQKHTKKERRFYVCQSMCDWRYLKHKYETSDRKYIRKNSCPKVVYVG